MNSLNCIEILVVSADEKLSKSYNPIEFQQEFSADWKQPELKTTILNDKNPKTRIYKKQPEHFRHRRYYTYDGLECWASIRVIVFKESIE